MASDAQLAGLCGRVGLDQAELRQTVKNILEVVDCTEHYFAVLLLCAG